MDWGLVPKTRFNVSPPEPKTLYVEITGSDAIIDLTESLTGYVCYKMRKCEITFTIPGRRSEWSSIYSTVLNFLQGEKLKVISDEDTDWYWVGRFQVSDWDTVQKIGEITISGDVEPYKIKVDADDHEFVFSVEGVNGAVVQGSKKHVVPVIDYTNFSAGEGSVYLLNSGDPDDIKAALVEGENRFPEIIFGEGQNTLYFRIDPDDMMYQATINIKYDIGSL